MAEGDQNAEAPNTAPKPEKSGGWRGILITAAFTLLGGIIGVLGKGYYDLAVEKEKSASELQNEKTKVDDDIQLKKEKFESGLAGSKMTWDQKVRSFLFGAYCCLTCYRFWTLPQGLELPKYYRDLKVEEIRAKATGSLASVSALLAFTVAVLAGL
jgi:hypothetical protein